MTTPNLHKPLISLSDSGQLLHVHNISVDCILSHLAAHFAPVQSGKYSKLSDSKGLAPLTPSVLYLQHSPATVGCFLCRLELDITVVVSLCIPYPAFFAAELLLAVVELNMHQANILPRSDIHLAQPQPTVGSNFKVVEI